MFGREDVVHDDEVDLFAHFMFFAVEDHFVQAVHFADHCLRILHHVIVVVLEYTFHEFELVSGHSFQYKFLVLGVVEEAPRFTC